MPPLCAGPHVMAFKLHVQDARKTFCFNHGFIFQSSIKFTDTKPTSVVAANAARITFLHLSANSPLDFGQPRWRAPHILNAGIICFYILFRSSTHPPQSFW